LAAPPASPLPLGADADAEVAVVVPVYGAPALVERCLDAVLAETTGRARLIVVDDASPDPAIAPLLERYAGLDRVELLRNATNRGFTASANRGIAAAGRADVVLLNADAEVGPNWLTGLRRAAYSRADVGTATAVSDDAGAFSVPELERTNALPSAWTFAQCARALWQHAGLAYPELPTGNGFCLYVRRAVLDAVGALDEVAFPQGYGEENDFCQRAAAAGFRHRIAGNVLVRHARSASFGAERRRTLGAAGMAVLRERWPNYEAEVGRTLFSFERRVLDWRVRRTYAAASATNAPRPRALAAGARAAPLPPRFEPWRVEAQGGELVLRAGREPVARAPRADAERALWDWLQLHAIEAVVAPPGGAAALAALPRLAAALGLAVAASADALDAAAAGLLCFAPRRTR
ncbi:MAG TPA: glycosyltransferase, partial [Dokdonella sp.]